MRNTPEGAAGTKVWLDFNVWADRERIPDEPEDWHYLWECYTAGACSAFSQVMTELKT